MSTDSKITLVSHVDLESEILKDLEGIEFTQLSDLKSSSHFFVFNQEQLIFNSNSGLKVSLDFSDPKYHRQFSPSKDLLCRACGWHLGYRKVWDLTAGFAVDALMLAQAGFHVTAFERNPNLIFLLRNALRTYKNKVPLASADTDKDNSSYLNNIKFNFIDSEKYLESVIDPTILPEVIYYDPMYPANNKTALPSKEMQLLREINGKNEERFEIVQKALKLKVKRVVVKRPLKAEVILEKPKFQLKSKLVRYDVY